MAAEEKTNEKQKKQKAADKAKGQHKEEQREKKLIKGIVRLAGKDLDGSLKLHRALLYIKGVSHGIRWPLANYLSKTLNVPYDIELNKLNEEQIEKINKTLFSLDDKILPPFLLNRRKDMATGKNMHVIMNDLDFAKRQDIEAKKKSRSWQGYRHLKGQKVRGQRTKNTGRTGMTVGVIKKKEQPAKAEQKKG